MCTQLSADSPLGPQVASSLRYCQLERGEMEGGRKAGSGREGGEGGSDAESSGSSGGEESEREGEFGRERVMESSRDKEERCGGDADKCATREKMGFMV